MAYSIYYPSGCDANIPPHYCNVCEKIEKARVRAVAFIAKDWSFTNPEDPDEWEDGIAQKKIIIVPRTNGSFDGGAEVESTGFGDQSTSLDGYNFQVVYNDPNYKNNADFYNEIKRSRNWSFFYKTETLGHLTNVAVQTIPKNPVAEELTSGMFWNVTVKWADEDVPVPFTAPAGIFECFDYTGVIV